MSTKHALLGLLLEGPSYPYQLADRLKERLGPSWALSSGQVYNTIRKMEEEELIAPVANGSEDQTRRRSVSITASGEREFEDWLEAILVTVKLPRRPELLKITLAPDRLKTVLGHIDAYEERYAKRLSEFRDVRSLIPHQPTLVRADHVLLRLNLSFDISLLEGELQRAREMREMLLWLHAQPNAVWPSIANPSGTEKARARQDARDELFEEMAATQRRRAKRERLGQP
ncbi:MAG TPA: PadR family transcriptional regulator [Solirubrobacteraceae bacterium]|jgi:DNA-binding PadR family transcriptional regulator|nr:PadR family transcriptional regulator [Solirubrobacteraceae bacterium]